MEAGLGVPIFRVFTVLDWTPFKVVIITNLEQKQKSA